MLRPKLVVLIILDGWGITSPSKGNAIFLAKKPNFDYFQEHFPVFTLQAAGESVGLSWGEMGNSEVGHLSLGSGKIIYQSLPRINRAISDGSFFSNESFLSACEQAKKNNGALHLMGLMSPGSVHSYNEQAYALVELAKKANVDKVFIHAFLDGRDTFYNSGVKYIDQLERKIKQIGLGEIATLSGRFYAMDRDNHWDRIVKAYQAMVLGETDFKATDAVTAIKESYQRGIYDEEFVPTVIINEDGKPKGLIKEGDGVIFFNFRSDRARELTKAFVLPGLEKFNRPAYLRNLVFVCMMEYEKDLPVSVAFPPENISYPLAKVLSEAGLTQLHLAETEKYAHVTFFFNGGQEAAFQGEERIIVPSPQIATYDSKPEMSAGEITAKLLNQIEINKYDFIVVNFANPDMVAHTGNLPATIKAVEYVDNLVGQLVSRISDKGGVSLITADHGNAEEVYKLQTGEIDKEHSSNPVPFYIIGKDFYGKIASTGVGGKDLSQVKPSGILADVAPTILKIMGLKRPDEMTGRSLI